MGKGRANPETDVTNFDYEAYSGDWYEIYRDKDFLFEPYDECVTQHNTYKPDEKKWKYWTNTVQYTSWKTPDPWKIGYVDGNDAEPGSLTKQIGYFNEDGTGKIKAGPSKSELNILSTDYTNYSLIYGCTNFNWFPIWFHNAWLLSRTPTLDDETVTMAQEKLTARIPSYDWPEQWN